MPKMLRVRVQNLSGPALDWVVAKADGWYSDPIVWNSDIWTDKRFSSDWAIGGPIIEREKIETSPSFVGRTWVAHLPLQPDSMKSFYHGPTPLIAAMRCFVAAQLGDEADVPDELVRA